jgi:hypothetical protein
MRCYRILLGLLLASCVPTPAAAITCVPFGDLAMPTGEELLRLNVKLTPLSYHRPTGSLVFRATGTSLDVRAAVFCKKTGIDYTADALTMKGVQLDSSTVRGLLEALNSVPAIAASQIDSLPYLSVSIIDAAEAGSRVAESIVDYATAVDVFDAVEAVLSVSDSATVGLADFACFLHIARPSGNEDLSDQASVSLAGFRLRRSDGRYVGQLRVKNTSGTSLTGALIVALRLEGSVRVTNPDGVTSCSADPPAAAYFELPETGLLPGATVAIPVVLDNPHRERIRLALSRVLRTNP